ncbi:MAG: TolC family protein [Mariprofundaceae bacterium]|nr:TolC family protein [Mariprofundaceae bacterium]
MRPLLVIGAVAAALGLGACTLGPDYRQPDLKHSEQWHGETHTDLSLQSTGEGDWWQQFNDPLLSGLIDQGLRNNRDLAIALANVERARALRAVAAGGYFPTLDAQADASRSRYSRQTDFGTNIGTRNSFSTGLDASWELDLFGRTRRSVESSDAQIEASEAFRRGVRLSMITEIAANYFEVRGLQRQVAMTRLDIALLKEVEEIAHAKAEGGIVTELDVARAQGERETFEASLPNLEAEIAVRIYRISVLTGQAPEYHANAIAVTQAMPLQADRVPVGLRSDILKRRPDVQQAERELAAATAGIGIARADMFPDFSLTGAAGTSARVFSDLFTPGTLTSSIGGALGWPVFAGGSLSARVDAAEAEARAALASYEQTVLLALEDAEGSLMRYGKEWQTLKRLRAAEATRKEGFEIAKLRYEAGEDDFLVMLDAERALIATRNDLISSETKILTNLTQLYKALGGGWESGTGEVIN